MIPNSLHIKLAGLLLLGAVSGCDDAKMPLCRNFATEKRSNLLKELRPVEAIGYPSSESVPKKRRESIGRRSKAKANSRRRCHCPKQSRAATAPVRAG